MKVTCVCGIICISLLLSSPDTFIAGHNQGKISDPTDIIFCGNPGIGKSTILSSISGLQFESGLSFGSGLTSELKFQESKYPGLRFGDTPGLADVNMKKKAAEAITRSLKDAAKNGRRVKIIFVVGEDAGRVRSNDFWTINKVMSAITLANGERPVMNTHAVVINKCKFLDDPLFKTKGKDLLEKQFNTHNDMNEFPTAFIEFLPEMSELRNARNKMTRIKGLSGKDLLEWIESFPGIESIKSVSQIDTKNMQQQLEEQEKKHKKGMDALVEKLNGNNEKALKEVRKEAEKTRRDMENRMKEELERKKSRRLPRWLKIVSMINPITAIAAHIIDEL